MCDLYCMSENLRDVVQLRNYNKCHHVCLCVLQGFKHMPKKKKASFTVYYTLMQKYAFKG